MYQQLSPGGKAIFWIITIAIWGALFTPLIISAGTLFPFQTGKGIAYRVIVEVAAFFYFWLLMVEPKARPKRTWLFWSVLAYFGVLVVTTILSVNPYRSFWGDIERMEGFFGIAHGILLFFIVYGLFRRKEDWLWFFKVSLLASFFVAIYGLAQVYPLFRFLHVFEARDIQPGSTLGNPAFVSTYAIFQIFFGVFVAISDKRRWWKIYGAGMSLLNLIILGLTAIRGAQVGMIAAVFVGAILAMIYVARSFKLRFALAAGLCIILAVPVGVRFLKDSAFLESLPLAIQYPLRQMSQISLQTNSAKTRLLSLGMAWQAFQDRPIAGWGLENFKVGYNKYFNPEHLTYEQAWFDRAHNKIAEVAVTTGAVGLISYLAIFAIGFFGVMKFLKKTAASQEKLLAIAVVMLGVAYFVQNLFLFDMPVSYPLFFASLAFTGFLAGSLSTAPDNEQKNNKFVKKSDLNTWQFLALIGIGGVTLFLIFWANWRPYQTAAIGRASMDVQTPEQALALYKQAISHGGFAYSEVLRVMEDTLIDGGRGRSEEWSEVFAYTKEQIEAYLEKEPTDPRFFIRTGKMYNERAFLEPDYTKEAERVLAKAMELSPTRPDAYYELGVTYLEQKNNDKAIEIFKKAVALNERNNRAHWVLGLAFLSLDRKEEGLVEIEKALELGYNWDTGTDINNLTQIYVSLSKSDKLAALYEEVVKRHPEVAQYRVTLAIAYANIGQKEKAKEQALKAVELDQQYAAGAEQFIKQLGL